MTAAGGGPPARRRFVLSDLLWALPLLLVGGILGFIAIDRLNAHERLLAVVVLDCQRVAECGPAQADRHQLGHRCQPAHVLVVSDGVVTWEQTVTAGEYHAALASGDQRLQLQTHIGWLTGYRY